MEVTKEALEKYTQAARKAYCSMPKFNDDRWQSATRAVLALVPDQPMEQTRMLKQLIVQLADRAEGEARALVEALSCKLGFGHVSSLPQEQPASDLERIQSSYSSGSQSGAQDQPTAAAPQTDAELVEDLCEAQFKKGAATNIRSVLSRLVPAKEPTAAPQTDADVVETLTHGRTCSAGYNLDAECTCGLQYRIHLQTEQTMHKAWRKRAEEAEAALAVVRAHDGERFSKEQLERIDYAIRDNYIAHGMNANKQFREQVLARLGPDKEHTSLRDACQVLENARQQAGKEHL
jgi:hypothetical protein